MEVRTAAALALDEVIRQGHSLTSLLPRWQEQVSAQDRPLLQELCYGVLRWYTRLDALALQLLQKPFKTKDTDVHALILLGLYQLIYLRVPDHAAVSATVDATAALKKPWARGLVNAVLRNFQRQSEALLIALDDDPVSRWAHPHWLIEKLRAAYPEQWQSILEANNQHPPLVLRINHAKVRRDNYLQRLLALGIEAEPTPHSEDGLILARPVDVESLPGFADGEVSVQDSAAQLAAELLNAQPGEHILDACAAPGGKTALMAELMCNEGRIFACDASAARLTRLRDNLTRMRVRNAQVVHYDLLSGQPPPFGPIQFDRILLDVPCSNTGVMRRRVDVRWRLEEIHFAELAVTQIKLVEAALHLLKPGGSLVYSTCSIDPDENQHVLRAILAAHPELEMIESRLIFPPKEQMDGAYAARLVFKS